MFDKCKLKIFNVADLVGRSLNIQTFKDDDVELIVAVDTKTGDLFVLKETQHNTVAK